MVQRKAFRARMVRPCDGLLIAPLCLDPLSAALAKRVGFDTVYLGGGGLGYARGISEALLTATEVAESVRAIREAVDVHVVVDGTTGFGDAVHAARAVRLMEQAGAAAIEIEDQLAPKRAHHHKGIDHMIPKEEMAGKIRAAVDARSDEDFLIIARCNAINHDGIDDALERAAAYSEAGADMLMLFPRNDVELAAVRDGTSLPLAAMFAAAMPREDLPDYGFALAVDAMSATVLTFQALKRGYEGLKSGAGTGVSPAEVRETMREVADTIDMERLYRIEAATTERALYEREQV